MPQSARSVSALTVCAGLDFEQGGRLIVSGRSWRQGAHVVRCGLVRRTEQQRGLMNGAVVGRIRIRNELEQRIGEERRELPTTLLRLGLSE